MNGEIGFRIAGVSLAIAVTAGCGAGTATGGGTDGSFELEISAGGATIPGRLDIVPLRGRPWGRLIVAAGREQTMAVRAVSRDGDTWSFLVGGPAHGLEITLGDEVRGTLTLRPSQAFPVAGRRVGPAPADSLLAHARINPIPGLSEPRIGESFTTLDADGVLYYSRHGLDLSDPVLWLARPTGEGLDPARLFPDSPHRDRSPFVSPDGRALFFSSDRPHPDGEEDEGTFRLWVAPRQGDAWGAPAPVRFEGWSGPARQPAVTAEGVLYFSSADGPGGLGDGDLYRAEPSGPSSWAAPRNPGAPVNGPGDEHGAWVSPDGRWMILVSAGPRPDAAGGDDLYLLRREGEGWSPPVPLPVNSFANEYGPWVTRDGRTLYFTSDRYGTADLFRVEMESLGIGPDARP